MKELKDYIAYYIGAPCLDIRRNKTMNIIGYQINLPSVLVSEDNKDCFYSPIEYIKPILRRVESMTYEEAFDFALMCMTSRHHLSEEDQITEAEMSSVELAPNDGGNLLNPDVQVYIGVSVRCFEGAVLIKKDGSIVVYSDGEEHYQPVDDIALKVTWLLSKHFDLFGLIESNLAIDAATLTQTHNK